MPNRDLVTLHDKMGLAAESFKMFRSNLNYVDIDKKKQVIMITSAVASEGKTTTAANTAISFAQDGEKTLLIECDLRRAKVHRIFNVPQSPGLTSTLADRDHILHDEMVHQIEGVSNLDVLTAGPLPPAPAEFLGSKAIETLFEKAREKYDRIIIDAPPILSVTDTIVLNRLVDGIVLVVAAGHTKKEVIGKALRSIDKIDGNLLGILMSKVNLKKNRYYGYYHYGYTYGEEQKKKGLFGRKKREKALERQESNN